MQLAPSSESKVLCISSWCIWICTSSSLHQNYLNVLALSLPPSFYPHFCLQSVSKVSSIYPHICNNKSALPQELRSPQVRAAQGGPPIREQPSIQWTVASLGLKTAASTVPLAHWRMDKALDFTLLKEGESARGAMKSIDPSLNGFVRGFRQANHGWKSPLNKAPAPLQEAGADSSERRRQR